ncbi:MAG: NAD-dependent epimerase/dehydratase family protein [Bryobacteraceae bacterium]|jgi:UDP-glucose 4-epimerase
MNALITGGAGFIGSHLAERCLREGWSVSVIDDLSTGSFENIAHLKHVPRFEYTIDTVFNAPLVAELVDCCDIVFHLAAAVGVRLIVESPVRTIETNVHGTEVVLRAAARKRKRVVVASTSEVYGKSSKVPFSEEDDLVMGPTSKGRWSYACSKALDEFLGLAYYNEKSVPVTVTRLFNTVGPRQTGRYGMVLPNFVRQALADEPITVHGDGHQSRCFGYVLDAVEALVRIAKSDRVVGEIINIGNDREITIGDLAILVRARSHSQSEIVHVPYEKVYGPGFEDMFRRVPSLVKLERLIGYRPATPLAPIIDAVASEMNNRAFVDSLHQLSERLAEPVPELV